ncbi:heavy-metal-associated domain-containing protein [Arthrobacter rhombi]|uniref:heavy-metal-associated domain-containing protein n=2 Tax=Arthrobacter rhombi TaxID=71253 RepID=UPI003FD3CE59
MEGPTEGTIFQEAAIMYTASFRTQPFASPTAIKDIESALSEQDGIISAGVEFNDHKVNVEYDSMKTDVEKIANLITKLGYPVLSTKVS